MMQESIGLKNYFHSALDFSSENSVNSVIHLKSVSYWVIPKFVTTFEQNQQRE